MDATRRKAQRLLFEKMLDTYDRDRAAELFARFAKNGTWQCPTRVVNRALAFIGDADFRNDSRLKYMPEYFRNVWQPEKNPLWASRTAEDYAASKRRYRKEAEAVAEMRRAGVRFIAGTDTGNPYCFPGFSLHDELALLVEAGFTPLEALQTATLNAAVFLGKADSLGTIEKGKIADLVLLEADPLENIGNTRKIAAVVLGGKIFEKPQLESMLSKAEQLANKKTAERPVLLPLAMAATAERFAQTPAAEFAGPSVAAPSITGQDHFAVPTLIIRPEKDFVSSPEEMLEFFGKLKTADKSYVCLPEGGHAIHLEKGHRRFQQVVLAFFDRPRRGTGRLDSTVPRLEIDGVVVK
jgi:hypothetical protein